MKSFLALFVFCGQFLLMSESFAARPVRGTYEVPTSTELESYAQIPVKFKANNYEGLETQIEFPLPQELTGVPNVIQMQKDFDGVWSGPQVNGDCQTQGRYFVCNMRFKNLSCALDTAKNYIQANYPASELSPRLRLVEQFCGEPIGILKYKLRGLGPDTPSK